MDNRIVITETDVTTNGYAQDITDIVYVPGFGDPSEGRAPAHTPTLCKTIAEFKKYFGERPRKFAVDQAYLAADMEKAESERIGFFPDALPKVTEGGETEYENMFKAGDFDPSYIYACELINRGLPVLYERLNDKDENEMLGTDDDLYPEEYHVGAYNFYKQVILAFAETGLDADRELLTAMDLQLKYVTTGGWPNLEFVFKGTKLEGLMLSVAQMRGDAIALLDHTNNRDRALYGDNSVFKYINDEPMSDANDTYGALFTPWANYNSGVGFGLVALPGSFAYFCCLAKTIETGANWNAISGVVRGNIPGLASLNTKKKLTNAIANAYQPDADDLVYHTCINPITYIKGYGYCIWGNRTLRTQSKERIGFALNFLNIRNLVCEVKKAAYDRCLKFMFEPNSNVLWTNFRGSLTPLLDKMKAAQGISDYQIIRIPTDDKTKLQAQIRIYPMYSIEKFEININITDEEVSVQ